MAHYAQINENNIVVQVIKANDELNTENWLIETFGGRWVQTSYNTHANIHYGSDGLPDNGQPLRYNYAAIGGHYDPIADAFYSLSPFPSWVINTSTYTWESPVPKPSEQLSSWNEETQSWDLIPNPPFETGWSWNPIDKIWYPSNPMALIKENNGTATSSN